MIHTSVAYNIVWYGSMEGGIIGHSRRTRKRQCYLNCVRRSVMTTQMASNESSPPPNPDEFIENLRFEDPDADVILCSCDHQEFRVMKVYVIKVSPVLRELIQSASSSHDAKTTTPLPSIQLSDTSVTLSSLLTFVLPIPPVIPSTIEQIMILLSAAQKYQMDLVLSHIRTIVGSQDPPFIRPETAFRVYSLAQTYGLRQETLHAARTTLTFSFTLQDLESELGTTQGVYLHELWKYYQKVRAYLTQDLIPFTVSNEMLGQHCHYGTLIWLGEYINSIVESPALFNITQFHMFLSRHANTWGSQCRCAYIPNKGIHAFWMALTNAVQGCMTKVGFDLDDYENM